MMMFQVLCWCCLAYAVWTLSSFLQNYRAALRIGLPVVITPVDVIKQPWWYLLRHPLTFIFQRLPWGLGEWTQRIHADWTYKDRFAAHAKYGPAFAEVSFERIKIFVSDNKAVEDILRRNNDFIKDQDIYGMLEVFGPNVDTVNGLTWSRHRKLTVPAFNEKNSALVWHEAIRQANSMASAWRRQASVSTTREDIQALALNVLCYAAFGINSEFSSTTKVDSATTTPTESPQLSYRESLNAVLSSFLNLLALSFIEKSRIPRSWLGSSLQQLFHVREQFKDHMTQMVASERSQSKAGNADRHNLIAALVRADMAAKNEYSTSDTSSEDKSTGSVTGSKGLTESEILGNLFIYSFAGHDTTASTLSFALVHLALVPSLQDWIAQEIDAALLTLPNTTLPTIQSSYQHLFARLPRLLALMHETLRHHGPTQTLPRITPANVPLTPLTINDRIHELPPKTMLVANLSAIHFDPATWSSSSSVSNSSSAADETTFEPRRFLTLAPNGTETCKDFSAPSARGFVAWSRGPRICPGKKFSQVEFVAVLMGLFRDGRRVQLVGDEEEDGTREKGDKAGKYGDKAMERARQRARRVMAEAEIEVALKMREDVRMRWFVKGEGAGREV